MSPARIECPLTKLTGRGRIVLEFNQTGRCFHLLRNDKDKSEIDVFDLSINYGFDKGGFDYVLFRGKVFIVGEKDGIIDKSQKAIEISNEGDLRTIASTREGFNIMPLETHKIERKYFAGDQLITRSGITLIAEPSEWRG